MINSNQRIMKAECDEVAGGLNLNLIDTDVFTGISHVHRVARFGGELCENDEDRALAKKLAYEIAYRMNMNYKRPEKV